MSLLRFGTGEIGQFLIVVRVGSFVTGTIHPGEVGLLDSNVR